MKGKFALIGLAVVAACVVGVILLRQPSVTPATPQAPLTVVQERVTLASAPAPVVTAPSSPATVQRVEAEPPPPRAQAAAERPPAGSPQPSARPAKQFQDPLARVALAFVGTDAFAEQYWLGAIFDPSLPDGEEREDLMEDLNEEGFDDPAHPGPGDIPLILSRLAIIERVAPYGDDFMIEHLGEAYKDLMNMYFQASR